MLKRFFFALLGASCLTIGLYAALTQTFERGRIQARGGGAILFGLVWTIFGAYILYAVFSERKK